MMSMLDDGTRGATLSDCGTYRYDLWRRWAPGPLMAWVMFNPSIADANIDDPTIGRCITFAHREGAAGISVRNLYAYRTPKPKVLRDARRNGVDVIGPDNDRWLQQLADDEDGIGWVIAAWGPGSNRADKARVDVVVNILGGRLSRMLDIRYDPPPPSPHPLYLPTETAVAPYAGGPS